MLISVNLSVTGLQFSRVLFFYNLHNHFGGIVEKRKKNVMKKQVRRAQAMQSVLLSAFQHTRSGQSWSTAAAFQTRHEGGIPSLTHRKPTITASPLQKLLSSSVCVRDGREREREGGIGRGGGPLAEAELHATLWRRDIGEWSPLKGKKGTSPTVCFGSCLIDLSTYEWMCGPSFPSRGDNGTRSPY